MEEENEYFDFKLRKKMNKKFSIRRDKHNKLISKKHKDLYNSELYQTSASGCIYISAFASLVSFTSLKFLIRIKVLCNNCRN